MSTAATGDGQEYYHVHFEPDLPQPVYFFAALASRNYACGI
jgi:hypothetical protein